VTGARISSISIVPFWRWVATQLARTPFAGRPIPGKVRFRGAPDSVSSRARTRSRSTHRLTCAKIAGTPCSRSVSPGEPIAARPSHARSDAAPLGASYVHGELFAERPRSSSRGHPCGAYSSSRASTGRAPRPARSTRARGPRAEFSRQCLGTSSPQPITGRGSDEAGCRTRSGTSVPGVFWFQSPPDPLPRCARNAHTSAPEHLTGPNQVYRHDAEGFVPLLSQPPIASGPHATEMTPG